MTGWGPRKNLVYSDNWTRSRTFWYFRTHDARMMSDPCQTASSQLTSCTVLTQNGSTHDNAVLQ